MQAKEKGEIKIVKISGVNFDNLQINFELETSGNHRWHINISYFANHIGLAISTEKKKPLTFSITASDCSPDSNNGHSELEAHPR